jgi:hypothetical protein
MWYWGRFSCSSQIEIDSPTVSFAALTQEKCRQKQRIAQEGEIDFEPTEE